MKRHQQLSFVVLLHLRTRRPCCRRELPRDAGHLYRLQKAWPNPRATQRIEISLQLLANTWWSFFC